MNKKREIFCCHCKYHEGGFWCHIRGYEGFGKGIDPITGEQDDIHSDCRIKNINRNCPDYEEKEKDEK